MSIHGKWDIILHTPMGKQKGKMNANVEGDALEGEINSPMGVIPMKGGKVDGDSAAWSCEVTKPILMNLDFSVQVEGDTFSGTVQVGPMGKNAVEGKRSA
jgi:hypothetical protein